MINTDKAKVLQKIYSDLETDVEIQRVIGIVSECIEHACAVPSNHAWSIVGGAFAMLPHAPDTPAKVKAKDDWFEEMRSLNAEVSIQSRPENRKKLAHNVH